MDPYACPSSLTRDSPTPRFIVCGCGLRRAVVQARYRRKQCRSAAAAPIPPSPSYAMGTAGLMSSICASGAAAAAGSLGSCKK